ncbi:MAG: tripartite tricarboxylate transporter TctB family protein [Proteobacteria bacterium]|nr:tripartite tricarboxylate transporter TctB family protein [Pseudomonadota bacterium]
MPMAWRNIIAATGLLAFSIWYAWAVQDIPSRSIPHTPGPSFFPYVIISIIGVLSLALLVKGLVGLRVGLKAKDGVGESVRWRISVAPAPTFALGAFFIYLACLPFAGFLTSSVLFFAALMVLYGCRAWLTIVIWSAAIPVVLFVIFTRAFQILLPVGPWGI